MVAAAERSRGRRRLVSRSAPGQWLQGVAVAEAGEVEEEAEERPPSAATLVGEGAAAVQRRRAGQAPPPS